LDEERIIELIDKRIKTWWNDTLCYEHNNIKLSPFGYIAKYINKLNASVSQLNNNEAQYQNNYIYLTGEISKIQKTIDNLITENKNLKNNIEQLKEKIIQQEKKSNVLPISSVSASIPSDNILKIFNDWAREPKTKPPSQFTFAEGELKLRENQNIKETGNNNSLWIINKSGSIKYLFPNPNAIDGIGGDIDPVYTVTGTRKAKGQNKINVLKACEIKDDGWIEYKGELILL
jgi:regulator of replication initiation timing